MYCTFWHHRRYLILIVVLLDRMLERNPTVQDMLILATIKLHQGSQSNDSWGHSWTARSPTQHASNSLLFQDGHLLEVQHDSLQHSLLLPLWGKILKVSSFKATQCNPLSLEWHWLWRCCAMEIRKPDAHRPGSQMLLKPQNCNLKSRLRQTTSKCRVSTRNLPDRSHLCSFWAAKSSQGIPSVTMFVRIATPSVWAEDSKAGRHECQRCPMKKTVCGCMRFKDA